MRRSLVAVLAAVSWRAAFAGVWEYTQEQDPMDSSIVKYASIQSDNSLALQFPYGGENHGQLVVRQRKKDGLNVIFRISKGQLICGFGPGECNVSVRFDEAQPLRFAAAKPDDHSSETLFIMNERRFVELAKKAKQIKVAVTVYQAGTQVLEFRSATALAFDTPKAAEKTSPAASQASQVNLMRSCNESAGTLTGTDRKEFMKRCLSKQQ